MPNKT
jgi:CRISPR-associated endonuclease/helicase Cas3